MKLLKRVLCGLFVLVFFVIAGTASLVHLVNWNDYKELIQNQTKKQTGRELRIHGDLNPSIFPWVGISVGEIELSNADGFGREPFARMSSANVKVNLLPLLRRIVHIRSVELKGLTLDLQRNAEGQTNWGDLVISNGTATTYKTDDDGAEVEVEGGTAVIAALAVNGIDVSDATVFWHDARTGTSAQLKHFNIETGLIDLAKHFRVSTDFSFVNDTTGLVSDMKAEGQIMIDLANQVYSIDHLQLSTKTTASTLPDGQLDAEFEANVEAKMAKHKLAISPLAIDMLGMQLLGEFDVVRLVGESAIFGHLSGESVDFQKLTALFGTDAVKLSNSNLSTQTQADVLLNFTFCNMLVVINFTVSET